jgi:dihydroxyacetone kinase
MNLISKEFIDQLFKNHKIIIDRLIVGKIMSSLEMHGFSITILILNKFE